MSLYRENTGSIGFVGFVFMGIFSIHDWLIGDLRYLIDGGLALLFLAVGCFYFRRWRQRQLRM